MNPMDFYNYILNTLPHRNDQEKVGISTALAALFGHPHPQTPDAPPNETGLQDVLGRFNSAGLGHVADSWISPGPNPDHQPPGLASCAWRRPSAEHVATERDANNSASTAT